MSELTQSNSTIAEAIEFAERAHGLQKYGDLPYTEHLHDVFSTLLEFGWYDDDDLLAAAYLHDVLEDTSTTVAELEAQFGMPVAALVEMVTNEPGRNRAERHAKTYPKIRGAETIALKLADRISNARCAAKNRPDLLLMYRAEYPEFQVALRHQSTNAHAGMWAALDDLLL